MAQEHKLTDTGLIFSVRSSRLYLQKLNWYATRRKSISKYFVISKILRDTFPSIDPFITGFTMAELLAVLGTGFGGMSLLIQLTDECIKGPRQ